MPPVACPHQLVPHCFWPPCSLRLPLFPLLPSPYHLYYLLHQIPPPLPSICPLLNYLPPHLPLYPPTLLLLCACRLCPCCSPGHTAYLQPGSATLLWGQAGTILHALGYRRGRTCQCGAKVSRGSRGRGEERRAEWHGTGSFRGGVAGHAEAVLGVGGRQQLQLQRKPQVGARATAAACPAQLSCVQL